MSKGSAAFRKILLDATDVTDIVSTRIYPEIMPQGVTYPAITYSRTTLQTDSVLGSAAPADISFAGLQVQCYATKYNEAHDLAQAVDDVLLNFRGAVAVSGGTLTVQAITRDNAQDLADLDGDYLIRRVILDYTLTYTGGFFV